MRRYFNDEQWKFLYELHCYGYTYKELAEWLGISHGTVQYNFYTRGYKCFDREPLSLYDKKFIALGGDHHA